MSLKKSFIEGKVDQLFVAYSNIYIYDAVEALKKSPDAEAVIIQPYESKGSFAATRKAIKLYRELKNDGDINIPILFTPQGRTVDQFFQYGAQLIDVYDVSNSEVYKLINVILGTGRWVLQAQDKEVYSKKDILVIKAPIVELMEKIPVECAINVLRHKRGKPTEAIAIPAPKLIIEEYKDTLKELIMDNYRHERFTQMDGIELHPSNKT